jgi:hypothetical protein
MNIPVGRNAGQKVRKGTKESSPERIVRQAIERAENEGMIVHSERSTSPRRAHEIVS